MKSSLLILFISVPAQHIFWLILSYRQVLLGCHIASLLSWLWNETNSDLEIIPSLIWQKIFNFELSNNYLMDFFCLVCVCMVFFFCFCVKPAPDAQHFDEAIGFLRDDAEVNVSFYFLVFFFIKTRMFTSFTKNCLLLSL